MNKFDFAFTDDIFGKIPYEFTLKGLAELRNSKPKPMDELMKKVFDDARKEENERQEKNRNKLEISH